MIRAQPGANHTVSRMSGTYFARAPRKPGVSTTKLQASKGSRQRINGHDGQFSSCVRRSRRSPAPLPRSLLHDVESRELTGLRKLADASNASSSGSVFVMESRGLDGDTSILPETVSSPSIKRPLLDPVTDIRLRGRSSCFGAGPSAFEYLCWRTMRDSLLRRYHKEGIGYGSCRRCVSISQTQFPFSSGTKVGQVVRYFKAPPTPRSIQPGHATHFEQKIL